MKPRSIAAIAATFLATSAFAQSNVSTTDKYSWGENLGWMNWRDANSGAQGARECPRILMGYLWAENAGWINLGAAASVDPCLQYPTSQSGTAFGVNIDAAGNLSGYAWGESVGWINFGGGALATPAQPARIEHPAGILSGRLRGYAWSENAGWINLEVVAAGQHVTFCYPNCDGSTAPPILNVLDFSCFLNEFAAGRPYANCDGSTAQPCLNVNDFQCFINQFAAGCT